MKKENEVERIKEVYALRKTKIPADRYSCFNPAALFISQQREKEVIKLLKQCGFSDLSHSRILDVGCGSGGEVRNLIRYGALPENLHGIDLLPDRIETALRISANIDFRCENTEEIPYNNDIFDIVMQFTVFTSILDMDMKAKIASEMLRVLKPQGIILWYDYYMNNPGNPDVRGVTQKEIHALFPNCDIDLKRITLAPPIARRIAPCSVILCQLLEKLSLLCTHYLGVIKKVGGHNIKLVAKNIG